MHNYARLKSSSSFRRSSSTKSWLTCHCGRWWPTSLYGFSVLPHFKTKLALTYRFCDWLIYTVYIHTSVLEGEFRYEIWFVIDWKVFVLCSVQKFIRTWRQVEVDVLAVRNLILGNYLLLIIALKLMIDCPFQRLFEFESHATSQDCQASSPLCCSFVCIISKQASNFLTLVFILNYEAIRSMLIHLFTLYFTISSNMQHAAYPAIWNIFIFPAYSSIYLLYNNSQMCGMLVHCIASFAICMLDEHVPLLIHLFAIFLSMLIQPFTVQYLSHLWSMLIHVFCKICIFQVCSSIYLQYYLACSLIHQFAIF